MRRLIVLCLVVLPALARADANDVLTRAREQLGLTAWTDRTTEVHMESSQDGGGRTRDATIQERTDPHGEHRTVIRFTAPNDQRGTRMLHLSPRGGPDEYWVWTDAARRARRIGGNAGSSRQREEIFFGNDMSYRDIEMLVRVLQWDASQAAATVEDGPCGDRTCQVVTLVPNDAVVREFPFAKYRLAFAKDDMVLRQAELLDRDGTVVERITCDGWTVDGRFRSPRTYTIEHLATKSQAVLTVKSISYDGGLAADVFTVAALERGS